MSEHDEGSQLDPCAPQRSTPVDRCEEFPDAPGCDSGAPDNDESGSNLLLPPFLSPWRSIDNPLITADREINIFNRNLFANTEDIFNNMYPVEPKRKWYGTDLESVVYKTGLLSSPPLNPDEPYNASERDRYVDYFRTTFRFLWTWYYKTKERFAPEAIPADSYDYENANPVSAPDPCKFSYLAPRIGQPVEMYDETSKKFTTYMSLGFETLEDFSIIYDNRTLPSDEDPVRRTADPSRSAPFFGPRTSEGAFKYLDSVFSAEQPFYVKELDKMDLPQFTSVSIETKVDFYEKETKVPEKELTSLYRKYYHLISDQGLQIDDQSLQKPLCVEDDRVQKFSSDSISQMKMANDTLKSGFNQYVQISINTQQSSKIASLLDEYQMDKHILEAVCSSSKTSQKMYSQILDEKRTEFTDQSVGYDQSWANDRFKASLPLATTDDPLYGHQNAFISTISDLKNRSLDYFKNIENNTYPLKYEYWDNPELLRFTDTLRSQIFLNKIEKQILTRNNLRSFKEILGGRKAFSEIIGYKIAKHKITKTIEENEEGEEQEIEIFNNEPIQEFYFMDSDKVLTIDFIDTQVNTGQKYVYRIYSLNFVLGSRYSYLPAGRDPDSTSTTVNFNVETDPAIQIIEAPFFQTITQIIERPPLAPQASFVPFQGVDNKMQILLQTNFGEKKEKPVKILNSDYEIFNKMYQAQGTRVSFEGSYIRGDQTIFDVNEIEYMSDSIPVQYQVFRMSTPPESYSDFEHGDYVKNLDTQQRTLLFIDEDFEPNRDYYYCFRTIDKVGISNPSLVFKVRMVSYANGIFMDLSEYEMKPLVEKQKKMTFQTAIKIEPAFPQRALQFDTSLNMGSREFAMSAPLLESVHIGQEQGAKSIWNKKYKVRITSKNSGKKIDLNVRFKKAKKEILPKELPESNVRECQDPPAGLPAGTGLTESVEPPEQDINRDRFRDDTIEYFEYNDEALQVYGLELRVLPGESGTDAVARFRGTLHLFDIRNIVTRGEDGTEQWAENGRPYRYELNYRPGGGYD